MLVAGWTPLRSRLDGGLNAHTGESGRGHGVGGVGGGCCHGFNLAQSEHGSIANRKKDSFSFRLTTYRWGITLGAWGGFVFNFFSTREL